ncbi:MAG TPA: hypothetical protein PLA24_11460 [Tenuifilaceae bacterium]|nr:hypothetical protein [Tenuifilaceae bacterium]
MINWKKAALIAAILLLATWIIGIIREYGSLSNKTPNPEYQKYIELQKEYISKWLGSVSQESAIKIDESSMFRTDNCIGSNFEGAEVKLAGVQFYDNIYRQTSQKPNYTYYCNGAILDPDHPVYGLPDIEILIGPVSYYQPEPSGMEAMLNFGFSKTPKPYKTYRKPLYDSLGKQIKMFEMQLWLTYFKVAITVISDRDKPQAETSESSLNAKIYPGRWYQSSSPFVSMNDLDHKEEWKNHLYGDITFVLEVNPNASPWYINTENAQTKKPDIAVGAVVCNELVKYPEDENRIHAQLQKGMIAPLYTKPFDSDVSLQDVETQVSDLEKNIANYKNFDIWNKKYYVKIFSKNIGSRQQGIFGQKKFDEQLEYTFMMPLLVVGSWDVQMPWDAMSEMEAPKPYYSSFSLRNLLPKWGGGFGQVFSVILIVGAIGLLLFAKGLLRK